MKRFVRGQVDAPEGMPSVYQPWLHYRRRGYEVHVLMIGAFDRPGESELDGCRIHLVPRRAVGLGRIAAGLGENLRLYRVGKALAREVGPPTVVYSLREGLAYGAWALARKFSATCVKRIYGTFMYDWWVRDGSVKARLACLKTFAAWRWPCDLTVITNDGTRGDRIARMLRLPRDRWRYWLNGTSKDWSSADADAARIRSEIGLAPGERMVLALGRLTYWKRHDRALRAMADLLRRRPEARLVVAGDGDLRDKLEALTDELGIRHAVRFLGMVAHHRVRELMSAADVFLLPYDLTCLCNTLLESQICGVPVVTWDVGDTRDIVTDNVNGRLLPNAAPEALAGAVADLLENDADRRRLAEGARQFAAENLPDWTERMNREIDLVESLRPGARAA